MTDTFTQNLRLTLPEFDQRQWQDKINNNFVILDALWAKFFATTGLVGVWQNATAYTLGQLVVDDDAGTIWRAEVTHTSASTGTFAATRSANPTYWSNYTIGVRYKGAWSSAVAYAVGDFVVSGNQFAVANSAHTSATFSGDLTADKWEVLIDGDLLVSSVQSQVAIASSHAALASSQVTLAAAQVAAASSQAAAACSWATVAQSWATAAQPLTKATVSEAQAATNDSAYMTPDKTDDFATNWLNRLSTSAPTAITTGDVVLFGAAASSNAPYIKPYSALLALVPAGDVWIHVATYTATSAQSATFIEVLNIDTIGTGFDLKFSAQLGLATGGEAFIGLQMATNSGTSYTAASWEGFVWAWDRAGGLADPLGWTDANFSYLSTERVNTTAGQIAYDGSITVIRPGSSVNYKDVILNPFRTNGTANGTIGGLGAAVYKSTSPIKALRIIGEPSSGAGSRSLTGNLAIYKRATRW